MTSVEYERLVRDLVAAFYSDEELRNEVTVTHDPAKPAGASGHQHQIDVAVRGPGTLLLIECKCWKDPIGIETVLTHFGRVADIQGANLELDVTGAVATTVGYQPGAHLVAKHFGIALNIVVNVQELALQHRGTVLIRLRGQQIDVTQGWPSVNITQGGRTSE